MKKIFTLVVMTIIGIATILPVTAAEKNKGELANIVCFVRFLGEDNAESFELSASTYQQMFNDNTAGANSVYNYFYEASYGQLQWKSTLFPAAQGDMVMSYRAKNERNYYKEKSSIATNGYEDEVDRAAREQALIKEIAAYLSANLPDDTVLDANNDGIVDNMCIVLSGRSEISNRHLLWPHRTDLALPDEKAVYIKDKKLVGFIITFDDANGWASLEPVPFNTGVICHEMSHSLGTYDLYHVSDKLNPVGVWDLMSDNLLVPQHMSAYTKYRYCGWIDEIPEITEPGTYTLNPVGGATKENIAYKIKMIGSDEYFVVEYRKKDGTFDAGLPQSGLLVYRINPAYTGGNASYNGTSRLDEVYIFRPGGTTTADGDVEKAAFSVDNGRAIFGGAGVAVKPFYSDGSEARFALTNITTCGETISFTFETLGHQIAVSKESVAFNGKKGDKGEITIESDVAWQLSTLPDWLTVSATEGVAGKTTITFETLSENVAAQTREVTLTITSPEDDSVSATVVVSQQSNTILPPSEIQAEVEEGSVTISWTAPQEGTPVLSEGFEDVANMNWTISNYNDRGWYLTESSKYYLAYSGNYSMYMKSAWDDEHQDEILISPTFANGKVLTFYSKSTAPMKNPTYPHHYHVEVSSDGGATWTQVYNLMTDCDVVNQYTQIKIDLSEYTSDNMKIAFHAWDDGNIGLSYWWQIDDVNVYPTVVSTTVTGYSVYRDGVKIGESSTTEFVDNAPLSGEHTYTVRAMGEFGETSDSEKVSVVYGETGIEDSEVNEVEVKIYSYAGNIAIDTTEPLKEVKVLSMNGVLVASQANVASNAVINAASLAKGVYVVVCIPENGQPVVSKVIL